MARIALEELFPGRDIVRLADGRRVALPRVYSGDEGHKRWKSLSNQDRGFIIKAITSFKFFFHYVYLPYQSALEREPWPEKLPRHWEEFCDDIEFTIPPELCPFDKDVREDGIWRVERLWPTGSGKTTVAVRALPIYLICVNPQVSVLLGMSTATLGQRQVANHRHHLVHNQRIIDCFGVMHGPDSQKTWKAEKICVDEKIDESSGNVEVFGFGGEFESVRFDIGITDDLVTKENCKTDYSRVAVYNWMMGPFHSRLHPHRRLWLNIGTVHHANDAHCRIARDAEEKGTWDVKIYRMVDDSDPNCPWPPQLKDETRGWRMDNIIIDPKLEQYLLWPEFWTPPKVVEDYISDQYSFALTRQNRPRDPESKIFQQEVIDNYCLADGGKREDGSLRPRLSCWDTSIGIPQPDTPLYDQYASVGIELGRRVLAIDAAATVARAGTDPDYTALELWSEDVHTHTRILLDLIRFRTQSPARMKSILKKWVEAYNPTFVVFETNAMARWSAVDLEESLGIPITKSELKNTKLDEIESFRDLAESGLLLIPWAQDGRSRHRLGIFVDELVGYPDEASHDDTLMAAVHAQRKLGVGTLDSARVYVMGNGKVIDQEGAELVGEPSRDGDPQWPIVMQSLKRNHPTYEEEWRHVQAAVGIPEGSPIK